MTFAVRRVEDNVHSEYRGGADSAGAPDQTVPGIPEPRPLEAEVSHIVYAELPVQAPLPPGVGASAVRHEPVRSRRQYVTLARGPSPPARRAARLIDSLM